MQSHKTCTKCGEEKPLAEYYKDRSKGDGYRTLCKMCHKENRDHYNARNPDANKDRCARYYAENRDKFSERNARYYAENQKQAIEYQRRYRDENPEKVAQSRARGYVRNREVVLDRSIRYYMENRESLRPLANRRHAERQQLTSAISIVPPGTRFGVDEDALLLEDNGMTVYQKAIALGRSYSSCRGRLDYIRSRGSV